MQKINFCLPVFILVLASNIFSTELCRGQVTPAAYNNNIKVNYVRTWDAVKPDNNPANFSTSATLQHSKMTTVYFDGLGRPLQTVVKKSSLETNPADPYSSANAVDLVIPSVYDLFGREVQKFLPFAANNTGGNTSISDGNFKLNPFQQQSTFMTAQFGAQGETWFYAQKKFEASPLDRLVEEYSAGNNWSGTSGQALESNRRAVKTKYWINKAADDVKKWAVTSTTLYSWGIYAINGAYPVGELYKIVTIDEEGKQVIEFRDKDDRLILKKVQFTGAADNGNGTGHAGWLCTYYVYDDLDQLRLIIQPRGVELLSSNSWDINVFGGTLLNEQCFRFEYDSRERMIMKKVPGAAEVYMVYDQWDRLVLAQDGNLRAQNKWMFTKYDQLNRPILTGHYFNNTHLTLSAMQAYLNAQALARFENYTPSGALPMYSMNLSFPVVTYTDVLTANYYDDYTWATSYSTEIKTFEAGYNNLLYAPSNVSWPYPQVLAATAETRSLVTGTIGKTSDGSATLVQTNWYDEAGRVIQTKANNLSGEVDINTTQYSFAGQPLKAMVRHRNSLSSDVTCITLTHFYHDDLGRLMEIAKTVTANIGGGIMVYDHVVIEGNEYNKLGQLKTKKLGRKKDAAGVYTSNPLETQAMDYNIRGYLLGVNRADMLTVNGLHASRNFAFELGYDKLTNAAGRNFTTAQYNGNISGMIWKTNGDGIRRKYDFTYDLADRLFLAPFEQNDQGGTWGTSLVDFTLKMGNGVNVNTAYDANGNIIQLQRWGLKVTGNAQIDNMVYNYYAHSNRLKNVIDFSNDVQTKLGDFRASSLYMAALGGTKTSSATDYEYDASGNLVKDRNKDIGDASNGGITYNHFNLPNVVTVRTTLGAVKGTITFTYDGQGKKIRKVISETGQPVKTIHYMAGAVYEDNVLQFVNHEDGRIRFAPAVGAAPQKFHFDYYLKDHLGNVRMVLTDEQQQDVYPAATLEGDLTIATDAAFIEKKYYYIDAAKVVNQSEATGMPAYQNNNGNPPYNTNPNGNATANSQKLYKLAATAALNGGVNGLSFTIKVMSGDKVDIWGRSYYFQNNTGGNNYDIPVTGILDGFIGAPGGAVGGKTTSAELGGVTVLTSAITSFLGDPNRNNSGTSTTPKAYVNYVLLDDNFRYVTGGFSRVPSTSALKQHHDDASMQNIPVTRNGYLYVYVSNQSPVNIFFDNLQVIHTRGPILEETHYYPFGLTMSAISSRASGKIENRNKFNAGSELQSKEFTDGSGLEWYDVKARFYDPQISRFMQVDPKPDEEDQESWASYQYGLNNPVSYNDPDGELWNWIVGAVVGAVVDYGTQVVSNLAQGKSLGASLTQVDGKSILKSAAVGAVTSGASAFVVKAGAKVAANVAAKAADKVKKAVETEKKIAEGAKKIAELEKKAEKLSKTQRPGKDMTDAGKKVTTELNKARNGGQTKCEGCGRVTQKTGQIGKGEKVPKSRGATDHFNPKANGGSGTPDNARHLCNQCNLDKLDKVPEVVPIKSQTP